MKKGGNPDLGRRTTGKDKPVFTPDCKTCVGWRMINSLPMSNQTLMHDLQRQLEQFSSLCKAKTGKSGGLSFDGELQEQFKGIVRRVQQLKTEAQSMPNLEKALKIMLAKHGQEFTAVLEELKNQGLFS